MPIITLGQRPAPMLDYRPWVGVSRWFHQVGGTGGVEGVLART